MINNNFFEKEGCYVKGEILNVHAGITYWIDIQYLNIPTCTVKSFIAFFLFQSDVKVIKK